MGSSYAVLATIVALFILFLFLSWIFVSIRFVDKEQKEETTERRYFLFTASYALGAVAVGAAAWPLIDQMNPDASVKALATTEVDISNISLGKTITVLWRGD
jgi:formate hydrogenlyase subunit 3/multisubunit Na+/H+ antiporter MnhD subunit